MQWIKQINARTCFKTKGINPFDITFFLQQFAALLNAGIAITQSLEILEKSQTKPTMRILIYIMKKEILQGKTLTECFRLYPAHFDLLICHLIQIGEQTGRLHDVLTILAKHQDKRLKLHKRIKQALFYPCFMLACAFLLVLIMLIFVIPRFAWLFKDLPIHLPLITRVLFFVSASLKTILWYSLLLTAAVIVPLYWKYHAVLFHSIKHGVSRLPYIRDIIKKIMLARLARHLSLTLAAGIAIVDALKLIRTLCTQKEFISNATYLQHKISAGLQLQDAMIGLTYFPSFMTQMVKVGEDSGTLDEMLEKTADFFEAEIEHLLTQWSQLIEPLLMLGLGALIGGLIIGIYLPIFKLGMAF